MVAKPEGKKHEKSKSTFNLFEGFQTYPATMSYMVIVLFLLPFFLGAWVIFDYCHNTAMAQASQTWFDRIFFLILGGASGALVSRGKRHVVTEKSVPVNEERD